MWNDLDFSRLGITLELEGVSIVLLNAKREVFHKSFPNHRHGFYELHYIFSGSGTLLCQNEEYPLEAGKLYLNGPNVYHEQLSDPCKKMMEYTFSFDVRMKDDKKSQYGSQLTDALQAATLWYGEDHSGILETIYSIEREIRQKETGYYQALCCLYELLLLKVIRNFTYTNQDCTPNVSTIPDSRRKFIIDEAFIYNYRDMTLSSLSRQLNLSERQTMRNIHQYYGITFSQFRQSARLNAAASLLQSSDVDAAQISEQVGFSSEAHFRKIFREKYGVTPKEYQLHYHKRKKSSKE